MRLKSGVALENLFRSAGREVTDRAPFSARQMYGVLCKRRGSRKHMMPGSTLSRSNAKPVKRKKPDSNEKLLGSVHVRPLSGLAARPAGKPDTAREPCRCHAEFFVLHGTRRPRQFQRCFPATCSNNASSPFSSALGDGGQPGMWRSTGTTSDTPPTQA